MNIREINSTGYSKALVQLPEPGTHHLMFRGDRILFSLKLPADWKGSAWLRTSIGHADIQRREIIRGVTCDETPLGRDWFDIPMRRLTARDFRLILPLCEVGHFEAKCFFLPEGDMLPKWPGGANTVINVEPADTCCANIVYNAFVRQFGPNKSDGNYLMDDQNIQSLDRKGYTVIPPSGTFRDLIRELDFIIGELGCRFIQLLPINPAPTTFARMGRFGSPYAALSFTAVDPALAVFDSKVTPLEQFVELADAVHERNAKIIIDLAINHTGWAAGLHETHPAWLVRDPEGRIEAPGAWGVVWEDLTRLDYSHTDLWHYMADVFLTWCRRGVDGFRCDAGYMIPVSAWKYIVASVREQYPDTVFFLEGLGGKVSVARDILNVANFNWAYSELFQHYDRRQIELYLPVVRDISCGDGILVHFCETHDNPRLAGRSTTYARMRTALCALLSECGGFGFANGVEWFATEKIDVHGAPSLNWGSSTNQVHHIRRLNRLLRTHPVFQACSELIFVQQGTGNHVAIVRHHIPTGKRLLVLVNLNDQEQTTVEWDCRQVRMDGPEFRDLLSGESVQVDLTAGRGKILLEAGQVLCLSDDPEEMEWIRQEVPKAFALPDRIVIQRLQAKVLDVFRLYHGIGDAGAFDLLKAAEQFQSDPVEFCRRMNPVSDEPRVITWKWPGDVNRQVMVPPGHFLMIRSSTSFHGTLMDQDRAVCHEESLPCGDNAFFAVFSPLSPMDYHKEYNLKLSVYTPGHCQHVNTPLVYLARAENARVNQVFHRSEILRHPFLMMGTNRRGAMMRIPVSWGTLNSRYDALLAANLHPDYPEDRWIMLSRCRAWVVFQGYSQQLGMDCLDSCGFDYTSKAYWKFYVPTGQGEHVLLCLEARMIQEQNSVQLMFYRLPGKDGPGVLDDSKEILLILRPDIENRNFHETTKAFKGPEHDWPDAVSSDPDGFSFVPDAYHRLDLRMPGSSFVREPEWHYMVFHQKEADRGQDPHSDLFSPGYFSVRINGFQSYVLTASISAPQVGRSVKEQRESESYTRLSVTDMTPSCELKAALELMLDYYLVNKDGGKTVIAGYPWFLDWGRDSLIFVRGLIAAGRTREARAVLTQFARFEKKGTLPNMIRGMDASNRDTSDAPLWFCLACSDLLRAEDDRAFLGEDCGGRTIRDILCSIADWYAAGVSNGIRMDPESRLIFSPSHFTWMDTNYPAGTPREGYPIEIQALWHSALSFMAQVDHSGRSGEWKKMAGQVSASILEFFWLEEDGYFSDCLHAPAGKPASQADADSALRPNQLLALTLEAVTDNRVCRNVVAACEELVVPGAIRSLADRPVCRPLPIVHRGNVINNPHHPYQGRYLGDEDTRRKPAYHNGTAWTWLFPSYCEALVKTYGDEARKTALSLLSSCTRIINAGCTGHVPEILDGDYPHDQRGCDAQAWGCSELYRVWTLLSK